MPEDQKRVFLSDRGWMRKLYNLSHTSAGAAISYMLCYGAKSCQDQEISLHENCCIRNSSQEAAQFKCLLMENGCYKILHFFDYQK